MSTYAFVCPDCAAEVTVTTALGLHGHAICPNPYCYGIMRRDYGAEGIHGGAELRRERRASAGGRRYLREEAVRENRALDRDAVRNRGDE